MQSCKVKFFVGAAALDPPSSTLRTQNEEKNWRGPHCTNEKQDCAVSLGSKRPQKAPRGRERSEAPFRSILIGVVSLCKH